MSEPNPERPGLPLPALRWRGLTLQMFLFTVLPLTVLLLAIAFGSSALHHESMRQLVGDRDLRAARAAASSLSLAAERRGALLDALAYQAAGSADKAAFLDQAARQYGFDGGLALLDASGQTIAQSAGTAPALLAAAQNGGTQVDGARIAVVQSGEGWLLAAAARPETVTLVGGFTPDALARDSLTGIASPASTVLLISASGDPLYQSGELGHGPPLQERPGVAEVLRGESGVNYIPAGTGGHEEHGGEHVVAFAPIEPFGWGLVLEEPWEETASPLLRISQSAPLILAPVLVLAIFALWFGARQVVQPLQTLERRAGQLAAGSDPAAIRQPVGGIREIINLQDALIEMTAALQSAQDALHGYIGALTAGVENERRSLARELHDDTLQALIALNQHVQMAMLRADPAQRQPLQDLQTRVTQTIASLRRAIGGLRPIYLEDLGLVAALSMLTREIAQSSSLEVTFDLQGGEQRLPPETELAFYRITQEALNNAAHHAKAQKAAVVLAFQRASDHAGASARLTIRDDGAGFRVPEDPHAFARLGHYGLLGMRERADLAGAEFQIKSKIGQGTTVEVLWKAEEG